MTVRVTRPVIRLSAVVLSLAVAASQASAQGTAASTGSAQPSAAPAPADSVRTALARRLLEAMNAGPMMLKGIEIGIPAQKAANPSIPEIFWTEFQARARREIPTFVERAVPIYASRFSKQELEQLIAFYNSPVGRRMAAESATIGAEMMRLGQMWGVELGADTAKDLSARGVLLQ
jgi:hypothetical protein